MRFGRLGQLTGFWLWEEFRGEGAQHVILKSINLVVEVSSRCQMGLQIRITEEVVGWWKKHGG